MYYETELSNWYLRKRQQDYTQGSAAAQNQLGFMYYAGEGVAQDYAEAFKWFRRSADHGYAKGQRNLGNMYHNGHGVARDSAEGFLWFMRAARQGDIQAQNQAGIMLAMGTGVEKDIVKAGQWFCLSAASGDRAGLKNRDYLMQFMSPQQFAESQYLARELWNSIHGDPTEDKPR
jgi:TPR repeat protein